MMKVNGVVVHVGSVVVLNRGLMRNIRLVVKEVLSRRCVRVVNGDCEYDLTCSGGLGECYNLHASNGYMMISCASARIVG